MRKICCLFSLVQLLLRWKTALHVQGNIVQKTVCGGICDHRLFYALVRRVSLPYLAFSSNPVLWLRHFLWALSTCSPYCAGIFYIWQGVGLSQLVCRSMFRVVRERQTILSSNSITRAVVQKTILENMIQLGRTTKHFSPGHLNVMPSLACY